MNPLVASPLLGGKGYTATIASMISQALTEAEARFGPRDTSYFLAGWEFVQSYPQTWFPGNRRHIIIQLGIDAINDFPRLVFQLSHEVIHLLSPTGQNVTNNLEEGLATYFSEDFTLKIFGVSVATDLASYKRARDRAYHLLTIDGDCIRRIRELEPRISRIDKRLLLEQVPTLAEGDANFLSARFDHEGAAI